MTFLHEQISQQLTRKLAELNGQQNMRREHPAKFLGREIDIVARNGDEITFYEIKTYNALILSIREAMGQLMEYAHWSRETRATKWVIITQPHADKCGW